MSATPNKRKTSDFLAQFKEAIGCTYSQDIVDGLRKEIADLKAENERLEQKYKKLKEAVYDVYIKTL